MEDRSKYYILGAFVLGVVLTATVNKRSIRSDSAQDGDSSRQKLKQHNNSTSSLAKINDLGILDNGLGDVDSFLEKRAGAIKEGIEGCIGDTPLIKIKSLSEYTGCDILAKAEVRLRWDYMRAAVLMRITSSSMALATAQKTVLPWASLNWYDWSSGYVQLITGAVWLTRSRQKRKVYLLHTLVTPSTRAQ
jgi:cysteine synthase A